MNLASVDEIKYWGVNVKELPHVMFVFLPYSSFCL